MTNIDGFDELQRKLERIDGENLVPFTDMFPPRFMQAHSDFGSIEEMFEASPWSVESEEDFEAIPEDEFDVYVDEHTHFPSWEAMLEQGGTKWISRQLE